MSILTLYGSQQSSGPLYDRGGAVYNVKAYGAVGDGVTDDYAAIMAAVAAMPASGGVLFFPAGYYLVGTPLAFSTPVSLWGAGTYDGSVSFDSNRPLHARSVIGGTLGGTAAVVGYTNVYGVSIRNMGFDGHGSSGYALKLDRLKSSTVEHIWCNGATVSNLWIGSTTTADNTQFCSFRDISATVDNAMSSSCVWIGSTSTMNVCHCIFENLLITHGWVAGDSNPGLYIGWSDNCRFIQMYLFRDLGTGYGILLDGAATGGAPGPHTFIGVESVGGLHATSGTEARIYDYDQSNGEPAPVIDSGANVSLWPSWAGNRNSSFITHKLGVGGVTQPATDFLHVVANDDSGLRIQRAGTTPVFRQYVDAGANSLLFNKPTGDTGSGLWARFFFGTIGGIDSINPFWNGAHFGGHTITVSGAGAFPVFAFYSRSTAATDPTDYEFTLGTANASTAPASLAFNANGATGAYIRFGFGEGAITAEVLRLTKTALTVSAPVAAQALQVTSTNVAGAIATGATLAVQNGSAQPYGRITVAPAGAVTGIILSTTGAVDGQELMVANLSAASVTFAAQATSHVQGGAAVVIPANLAKRFTYVAASSVWVATG